MLADDTGNVVYVWAQRRSHRAGTSSIFTGLVLASMQMTPDLVRPTTNSFSRIRGLARASLKNIASHVLSSEETTPHHILHTGERNAECFKFMFKGDGKLLNDAWVFTKMKLKI
nr:hypothetical protein [Tanacetum cinerariifolium]